MNQLIYAVKSGLIDFFITKEVNLGWAIEITIKKGDQISQLYLSKKDMLQHRSDHETEMFINREIKNFLEKFEVKCGKNPE